MLFRSQGLSYMSWMAAWALAKDFDAAASYTVLTDDTGKPYFSDDAGAFVGVSVTLKGDTLVEYLPVLDYKNKAVRGENLDVFDINSAIKRCLVKCLAMHGLGSQVYINGAGTPLDLDAGLQKAKPAKSSKPNRSF